MESENSLPSTSLVKCCDCNCKSLTMKRSFSETYLKSLKCIHKDREAENRVSTPRFIFPQNARVEVGNECMVLRDTVGSQQKTIQDLISELEEERNAASSAANEAMSMILRLQRDKAEIEMDARQFKIFAEEKMAHDQEEIFSLGEILYQREQAIMSLTCAVESYRHRMMSYGLTEGEADGEPGVSGVSEGQFPMPSDYPHLKCNSNESWAYPDVDKYASGETPVSRDQLKDLECRINQLERSPRTIQPVGEFANAKNVLEKIIVGQSPRTPGHLRKFSFDSAHSPFATGKEIGPDFFRDSPKSAKSFKKTEFSHIQENSNLSKGGNGSEVGDDSNDRIYTIDSVYQGSSYKASFGGFGDERMAIPGESPCVRDIEIQKLYARLHALEADRESMRQAIVSIGTDKAQVLLMKEIAQNLCKQMPLGRSMPVRKESAIGSFFFMSLFKWILPIFFWRKKARRCRYMFGLSPKNAGLLMLLERDPRVGQWRCILRTGM